MDLLLPWLRLAALCAAVIAAGTLTAWLAARAAIGRERRAGGEGRLVGRAFAAWIAILSLMSPEQQLQAGIAALEAQRPVLGDAVVDASIAGLRARLAELAGAAAPAGQALRQVSILFLDVVGSTTLVAAPRSGRHRMPWSMARWRASAPSSRRIAARCCSTPATTCSPPSAPTRSREDDPERAVRCGLALLAEGQALGAEVQATHGHTRLRRPRRHPHRRRAARRRRRWRRQHPRHRRQHRRAHGADRAARRPAHQPRHLCARCAACSRSSRRQPMAVKGVDAPIAQLSRAARRAARRSASPTRGIEGVATRMVGRDAELEAILQDAFRAVSRRSQARRRHRRRRGRHRQEPAALRVRSARPSRGRRRARLARPGAGRRPQSQPYGLLRDIVAWIAADSPTTTASAHARAKVERRHRAALRRRRRRRAGAGPRPPPRPPDRPRLQRQPAHPRHPRRRAADPRPRLPCGGAGLAPHRRTRRHAGRAAARRPALGRRRLARLPEPPASRRMPTCRCWCSAWRGPALFERRTDWPGTSRRASHRARPARPQATAMSLADELLKKLESVPPALRELVTGGAEGNPFYMEELVKMLVDEGAIVIDGERWTAGRRQAASRHACRRRSPACCRRGSTACTPHEKQALQQAAVIGFVFWDQALAAIDARRPRRCPAWPGASWSCRRPEAQPRRRARVRLPPSPPAPGDLRHRAQAPAARLPRRARRPGSPA